jgi:hypothetical protein
MAGILSWEARNDSIAAGEGATPTFEMLFIGGGR